MYIVYQSVYNIEKAIIIDELRRYGASSLRGKKARRRAPKALSMDGAADACMR